MNETIMINGIIILFASVIVLIILRIPVAFALGGASLITALYLGIPLYNIFLAASTGLNSFSFMAIPFFMLMGQIMCDGEIATRIIRFCNIAVGRIRGGTAIVNIFDSMLFGGISGSAIADVSSLGAMIIPAMKKEGYDTSYAVAITTTSSVQGVIIPPSQNMIYYCIFANAGLSISTLFVCGYVPGVLLGLGLLVPTIIIARKRKYPISEKKSWKENLTTIKEALFGLFTMVIIIVCTTTGVCSATESAAIAAFYALLVTVFIYKNMTFKKLWNCVTECVSNMTMIMATLACVMSFVYVLSYLKAPLRLASILLTVTTNRILLMFLVIFVVLILGCFMDMGLILLMLTPVFVPVATDMGYSPYHFGIVFILACAIGLVTPPVGNAIILACDIGKIKVEKCVKDLLPFVASMVAVVILLLLIPDICLFLPRMLGLLD